MKKDGRNFTCEGCPERVQKLRRCKEDREDFTEKDGAIWPMYIEPGGEQYGFCPSKATWDPNLYRTYQLLVVAAESGAMIEAGGLRDQPAWWIETLGWFLPRYDSKKFQSRMGSVLGNETVTKTLSGTGKGKGRVNGSNK